MAKASISTKYGSIEGRFDDTTGSFVHISLDGLEVEVINIVDHAKGGRDERVKTQTGLESVVREWFEDQEEHDPSGEWHEIYLRNN